MESLNVADAKRRFSELLDRVARGERFVVTRRGRPTAVLVPPTDGVRADEPERLGLLAFVGTVEEWPEYDEIMRDVVASRRKAGARPAPDVG